MIIAAISCLRISAYVDIVAFDSTIHINIGLGKAGHIDKMCYFRQVTNRSLSTDIHVTQSIDCSTLANLYLGLSSIFKACHTQKFCICIATTYTCSKLNAAITLEGFIVGLIGVSKHNLTTAVHRGRQSFILDSYAGDQALCINRRLK